MSNLPEKLVFVDVETTGSNPQSDRIIEIGIVRVEDGKIVDELNTLINPNNAYLSPFISNMTGISQSDLSTAPLFEEVRTKVKELLSDAIFVAHNVNFDYSFIKHEFMRLDDNFNATTLCTVRLARNLFPTMQKYNLDVLTQSFNLKMENRHRAYDDAYALWDFYLKTHDIFDQDRILEAINAQLKTSIPDAIERSDVDNLPDSHGVYMFWGKPEVTIFEANPDTNEEVLLYVGKSNNIRSRVLSHFSSQKTSLKSQNIAKQVTRIDYKQTHGELGALIRESQMIKDLSPIFNRALRRRSEMNILIKSIDENGYYRASFKKIRLQELEESEIEKIIGVYNSKKQANEFLRDLAKSNRLCPKLLGLEKYDGKPCFNTQLGYCDGACTNSYPQLKYNLRFLESFSKSLVPKWPFDGAIGIEETGYLGREVHVINKWCYHGSIVYDKEGNVNETFTPKSFDWDIYKLVKKYVNSNSSRVNLINLGERSF